MSIITTNDRLLLRAWVPDVTKKESSNPWGGIGLFKIPEKGDWKFDAQTGDWL